MGSLQGTSQCWNLKKENKEKKLGLLKEVEAFPAGKTEENITVIQIVMFLKVFMIRESISLSLIKTLQTSIISSKNQEMASTSFWRKLRFITEA